MELDTQKALERLLTAEESVWRQRSRIDWLQLAKFQLNAATKKRSACNHVGKSLKEDGSTVEDSNGIREHAVDY